MVPHCLCVLGMCTERYPRCPENGTDQTARMRTDTLTWCRLGGESDGDGQWWAPLQWPCEAGSEGRRRGQSVQRSAEKEEEGGEPAHQAIPQIPFSVPCGQPLFKVGALVEVAQRWQKNHGAPLPFESPEKTLQRISTAPSHFRQSVVEGCRQRRADRTHRRLRGRLQPGSGLLREPRTSG